MIDHAYDGSDKKGKEEVDAKAEEKELEQDK